MAGQTIGKVVAGGKTHTISSTFYGTCSTAIGTAAKEVIINEVNTTEAFTPIIGMLLCVKFTHGDSTNNSTLTLYNNAGTATAPVKGSTTLVPAIPIIKYGATSSSVTTLKSWTAGAIVSFVYDGSSWIETSGRNSSTVINIGATLLPTYVGSMADLDRQHASCCRHGNIMWTFSVNNAKANANYSSTPIAGLGIIRSWDLSASDDNQNSRLWQNTDSYTLCHANSVAYDTVRNCIWLCPMTDYSQYNDSSISSPKGVSKTGLYRFDVSNFSTGALNAPVERRIMNTSAASDFRAYGVSFDAVTQTLYAINIKNSPEGNESKTIDIYKLDSNVGTTTVSGVVRDNGTTLFTKFASIYDERFYIADTNILWQDFAVYNNVLYAARLDGTIYIIPFDSMAIEQIIRVSTLDMGGLWRYGELEGLEFDSEGRLYNMRDCPMVVDSGHVYHTGFVTELNTSQQTTPEKAIQLKTYGELTVVPRTKFRLQRYEIHTLNEYNWRLDVGSNNIKIPSGLEYTEYDKVRILRPAYITIEGTANFYNTVEITSGILGFYIKGSGASLNFKYSSIRAGRYHCISSSGYAADVMIRTYDNGTITVEKNVLLNGTTVTNNFVNTGFSPGLVRVGSTLPNITGYTTQSGLPIAGYFRTAAGLYMGAYKIYPTN